MEAETILAECWNRLSKSEKVQTIRSYCATIRKVIELEKSCKKAINNMFITLSEIYNIEQNEDLKKLIDKEATKLIKMLSGEIVKNE